MAEPQAANARDDARGGVAATEGEASRPARFRDQWSVLVTTPQSPQRWAVIADAIRIADAAPRNAFGDPIVRGGEDWCRLAITALESPHGAAQAKTQPAALPDRCLADAELLRGWLTAPHAYADTVVATNADGLGLVDWAEASDDSTHRAMDNLLTAVQDAGIYGVRDFSIELHRLVDADSWYTGHLIVVRPTFGPGLASPPLAHGDLVPAERARVDGAVSVLTAIATVVNDTPDTRDAAQATRERGNASRPAETNEHAATRTQPFPPLSRPPRRPTRPPLGLVTGPAPRISAHRVRRPRRQTTAAAVADRLRSHHIPSTFAWEDTMTDPFDTASGRWGLIFHGSGQYHPSHSRQEWAQLAGAIGEADRVFAAESVAAIDPAPVRGDDAWCQVAVESYWWLHSNSAWAQRRPGDVPRCFADEDLVRAWLDAPWVPPGDEAETVAQMTGYDIQFEQGRLPDPADITMLVGAAQDAGVFGIPDHRINVWRYFGDGTFPAHTFTVTVRPPDGPGITSSLIGGDQLVQVGREPVAVIADVLKSVAGFANDMLSTARTATHGVHDNRGHDHASEPPEPIPEGVQGWSTGLRGRPFPVLTAESPTSASPSHIPPTSPFRGPRRPRT